MKRVSLWRCGCRISVRLYIGFIYIFRAFHSWNSEGTARAHLQRSPAAQSRRTCHHPPEVTSVVGRVSPTMSSSSSIGSQRGFGAGAGIGFQTPLSGRDGRMLPKSLEACRSLRLFKTLVVTESTWLTLPCQGRGTCSGGPRGSPGAVPRVVTCSSTLGAASSAR